MNKFPTVPGDGVGFYPFDPWRHAQAAGAVRKFAVVSSVMPSDVAIRLHFVRRSKFNISAVPASWARLGVAGGCFVVAFHR